MNRQPNITTATKEAFVSAFFQLAQEKNIHQITIHETTTSPTITAQCFSILQNTIRLQEVSQPDGIL